MLLFSVSACVLIILMFYSAQNVPLRPQTVNGVLLGIKGMSAFLKVWSGDHPGPGVLVKKTESRAPF